jgi:hypothetical protein
MITTTLKYLEFDSLHRLARYVAMDNILFQLNLHFPYQTQVHHANIELYRL